MKTKNVHRSDRRDFLKTSTLAGASLLVPSCGTTQRHALKGPDEKLNIAIIGGGGKGYSDMMAVSSENIVAICDVDTKRAERAFAAMPDAKKYSDYRELLAQEADLDAVVISTPDHSHAVPALLAMDRGLHVYCQKPLTHTVEEARLLRLSAERNGVVTQMGNQGTATDGFKEATEVIQSGALGPVRRVHVWTNRPIWPQGMGWPEEIQTIPDTMRWDLFRGPAPYRPYNSAYAPFAWRGWWDYGTGALGDMACHIMNLAYNSLELYRCPYGAPSTVEVLECEGLTEAAAPLKSKLKYQFPERGDLPAVDLFWYDGGNKPSAEIIPGFEYAGGGTIIEGDEGVLYSDDDYGARYRLFPEDRYVGYKPPKQWLARSPRPSATGDEVFPQHELIHQEWLAACRGQCETSSNFDYAGPFTEAVLLGNVALRTGHTIRWDPSTMQVVGNAEADHFIRKHYSWGFELPA